MRNFRRLRWSAIPIAVIASLALAGCTPQQLAGYLPGFNGTSTPVTNQTERIESLWVNSWIVLLVVGLITWALTIWAVIAYRRRKGQTGLPAQLRYNMPLEVFYTVIPLVLVLGFFAFTAKDQAEIEARFDKPDVTISAIGKQWAWDFNYVNEDVYTAGVQAQLDTAPGATPGSVKQDELPTLVLPVGKKVEIQLNSRDVIHSFWVVDFLYKKDMIPGRTNYMSIIPEREGTYAGKCAELCGEYHSLMLFNVKVVSQAEYDKYIAGLKAAGNNGQLGLDYNRDQNLPGATAPAPAEG